MFSHIAFATCSDLPNLEPDDRLALPWLQQMQIDVVPAIWNDTTICWQAFDAVVIRSTWDYYRNYGAFVQWFDHLQSTGIPVWNPVPLMRWNMDKRYLQTLEQQGIPIVPTVWLAQGAEILLSDTLASNDWTEAIIKPAISAGAFLTWRTSLEQALTDQHRLQAALDHSDVLIQPFVHTICTEGEWSFIFLGGSYSHTVVKRPQTGDFRVQEEHGGSTQMVVPSAVLRSQAQAVVDCLTEEWLYARVDGVVVNGTLLLMELELIEPTLFLAHDAFAPQRFAQALGQVV